MNTEGRRILLVEDNEDDVFLMRRALKTARLPLEISVAHDGQEAIDYLSGLGDFADRTKYPLPSLVLLDLKMPRRHGFEVLSWIRAEPTLKDLTVVVLTSSPEERDRKKASELGAHAYRVKPPTAEMIHEIAAILAAMA